ncbi:hypothetical protein OEZ86_003160 [Tetradesmus obliquus]|nr:hypothetical protein OEZ86_003160 [Tetradesmus obliquus]
MRTRLASCCFVVQDQQGEQQQQQQQQWRMGPVDCCRCSSQKAAVQGYLPGFREKPQLQLSSANTFRLSQGVPSATRNMRGYKTSIIALHCAAGVCAIIVIGIAAYSLAEVNKASRQVNQYLQQSMEYLQGLGLDTVDWMQEADVARKGPETLRLGFLMFVAVVGLLLDGFMVALQLLPRVHDATLGALASKSTAAWLQRPFFEVVLSALWSVMWLAGAAAVSHLLEGTADCAGAEVCDLANALLAFSWLSWLLWCAGTALMAWTWSKTAAAAACAAAAPGAAASAMLADGKGAAANAAAAAGNVKTGVPVSAAPQGGEKPGSGADAV